MRYKCKYRATIIFITLLSLFLAYESAFATEKRDLFTIEIPFSIGGKVTITDFEDKVYDVGVVTALPTKTRWPSYTASAWGEPGHVCASAVNAIHMLVAVENNRGRTLSIIPKETIAPAAGPGASLVVSSTAGEGIFGAWAPPVGTEVKVRRSDGTTATMGKDALPAKGDTLIINVAELPMPYVVEIENRPSGRVTAWTAGDGHSVIGRVLLPLGGTGRFEGTKFQRTGALRANHCGVIDISTSKYGQIGGFQIIPWEHSLSSKEMQNAWNMTQWMIIAPADGRSKLGAAFPLFKGALVSGPATGEKLWDIWSTYGRKSLVTVRLNGGKWQKMPEYVGRNDTGLKSVTHLRLYFPFTDEPQKD